MHALLERQRALGAGHRALPPGSAHVPLRATAARRGAGRTGVRRGAARDRAQCPSGKSARRPRGAAARVGRELRLAAAGGCARLPAHRFRARAHGRGRADAEAAEPAVQRPQRRAGRGRGNVAGRALRARSGGPGDRRGGAAPRPARLVRAGLDDAGVGRRGSHRPLVARRATAVGDGRARSAGRGHRARGRCPGGRAQRRATLGAGAESGRAFVREHVPYLTSYEQMPLPLEDLARRFAPDRLPRDDIRHSPAPVARGLRRRASRAYAPPFLDGVALTTQEGRFEVDLGDHALERRLEVLDRDEIDVAVLSLQTSLGFESVSDAEQAVLEEVWVEGAAELVARVAAASERSRRAPCAPASRECRSGRR